ncbi:MAG TPA: dihydrolipoyl dehydrogenase [Pseudoclavibacter sp.]|nr:dihydrolipoyl dehydrogenase [Pseudoclavibacter sp.]
MSDHTSDVVVLGGGSAGYATAIRAVELGKTAVLIEKDKVGGTCLHRGCVPTKALLHSAEIADDVRESGHYGIQSQFQGIDMHAVAAYKDGIVSKKFKGLQGLLSAKGVTTIAGEGRLVDAHTVAVGDDTYTGAHVVLATGSYSKSLPGLEITGRVITSEQALQLDYVPQRVAILGGGVIGVEFASVWRSYGAEVTIIEGLPHLVPNEEESISKALERAFRKRGISFSTGVRFSGVTQSDTGVTVSLENGASVEADLLLVAVGRGPSTSGIGLEEAGVTLDRGFVVTNDRLETSVPGVYAVGDIVPGLQLAHRGYQQGIFVAEEISGLHPSVVPDVNIPRVTYCDPEIMSIGLTKAKAVAEYGAERVVSFDFNLAGNAKSEILGGTGFVSMVQVVDGPIVGVHGIGPRIGELVGESQLIVNWEAHPSDIAPFIHGHPTQNEMLGEIALYLAGKPLHTL